MYTDIADMRAALDAAQKRIALLEELLGTTRVERDDAIRQAGVNAGRLRRRGLRSASEDAQLIAQLHGARFQLRGRAEHAEWLLDRPVSQTDLDAINVVQETGRPAGRGAFW